MDLEGIMLSKVSQTEKDKYHYDFTHVWNIKRKREMNKQNKTKHIDTQNRLVVTRGERRRGRAKWVKGVSGMVMDGS